MANSPENCRFHELAALIDSGECRPYSGALKVGGISVPPISQSWCWMKITSRWQGKVLLQLKAINALKRRESAQALYTFIESLPRDPAPISLARLRARLNLKSPVFSQNQTVRRAMEQLREIGYLDYTEIQRGRTKFFCIHYRRPRLKAPNDESKENQLPPSPAEKISPEMAEKLALLEKLGITLDDLEKLFKSR